MTRQPSDEPADPLASGGDIRTMDARRPRAQALAARAGRIVAQTVVDGRLVY